MRCFSVDLKSCFVCSPRLNMRLVEHRALAISTGVPRCGYLRLPLAAPPASAARSVTCTDWVSIASDWAITARGWASTSSVISSILRSSASRVSALTTRSFPPPSGRACSSDYSYRERSFLQDLSNQLVRVGASVPRIPRLGQIKAGSFNSERT